MSGAADLLARFDDGTLLRPDESQPHIIDLAHALADHAGAAGIQLSQNAQRIAHAIGPAEHVVFVLIDGLGMHLVEPHAEAAFFREHLAMELRTVFPTSTAPVLTSLATGRWPAEHAVPGWWTYLPGYDVVANILPFTERFGEKPLRERGVDPHVAFPSAVLCSRYRATRLNVLPKAIEGSVYTRWSSANAPGIPYQSMQMAVEQIHARVRAAGGPTETYWYIPFVDNAQHEHGPWSKQTAAQLRRVAARVRLLCETLAGKARVVITADHGQIEPPRERIHVIERDDPLAAYLRAPVSCEPRVPAFHLRPGAHAAFAEAFRRRFDAGDEGAAFALFTLDEADELRLFGPAPLSDETRRRLGDYVAVSLGLDVLLYAPDAKLRAMRGFHGGLLPDEVRTPLVIV